MKNVKLYLQVKPWENGVFTGEGVGTIVSGAPSGTAMAFSDDPALPATSNTGAANFAAMFRVIDKDLLLDRLQQGDIDFFISLLRWFPHTDSEVLAVSNYNLANAEMLVGALSIRKLNTSRSKALLVLSEWAKKAVHHEGI